MAGQIKIFDETGLLRRLADGHWYSGEALAREFGVSRAAVWKRLQRLERLPGIRLEKRRGRGYRLQPPLELLDRLRIGERLEPGVADRLQALELLLQTDSTNDRARELSPALLHTGSAVFAEHQTAGRGRRGRRWISGFGRNLCLSLAWRFDLPLSELPGLSLAAGVALAGVLERAGLEQPRLKWPNDLLVEGRKLAGILVEASGEAAGPCTAVIGIGVNLHLEGDSAHAIEQPWTDLRAHLSPLPSRNRLAGELLNALVQTCLEYQNAGLAPFFEDWQKRDAFRDRAVELRDGAGRVIRGTCRGVDPRGALLLELPDGVRACHAGELSLRGAEDG